MWTLLSAGGDRINVFDNMLEKQPWENSGYRVWFEAMEIGQTDRWMNSPILLRAARDGRYLNAVAVQLIARHAKPDIMVAPEDVWELSRYPPGRSGRAAIVCGYSRHAAGDHGREKLGLLERRL